MKKKLLFGVGVLLLIGGLLFATGVTSETPDPDAPLLPVLKNTAADNYLTIDNIEVGTFVKEKGNLITVTATTDWKGVYPEFTTEQSLAIEAKFTSGSSFEKNVREEKLRLIKKAITQQINKDLFKNSLKAYTDEYESTQGDYSNFGGSTAVPTQKMAEFMHLDGSKREILLDGDGIGISDGVLAEGTSGSSYDYVFLVGANHLQNGASGETSGNALRATLKDSLVTFVNSLSTGDSLGFKANIFEIGGRKATEGKTHNTHDYALNTDSTNIKIANLSETETNIFTAKDPSYTLKVPVSSFIRGIFRKDVLYFDPFYSYKPGNPSEYLPEEKSIAYYGQGYTEWFEEKSDFLQAINTIGINNDYGTATKEKYNDGTDNNNGTNIARGLYEAIKFIKDKRQENIDNHNANNSVPLDTRKKVIALITSQNFSVYPEDISWLPLAKRTKAGFEEWLKNELETYDITIMASIALGESNTTDVDYKYQIPPVGSTSPATTPDRLNRYPTDSRDGTMGEYCYVTSNLNRVLGDRFVEYEGNKSTSGHSALQTYLKENLLDFAGRTTLKQTWTIKYYTPHKENTFFDKWRKLVFSIDELTTTEGTKLNPITQLKKAKSLNASAFNQSTATIKDKYIDRFYYVESPLYINFTNPSETDKVWKSNGIIKDTTTGKYYPDYQLKFNFTNSESGLGTSPVTPFYNFTVDYTFAGTKRTINMADKDLPTFPYIVTFNTDTNPNTFDVTVKFKENQINEILSELTKPGVTNPSITFNVKAPRAEESITATLDLKNTNASNDFGINKTAYNTLVLLRDDETKLLYSDIKNTLDNNTLDDSLEKEIGVDGTSTSKNLYLRLNKENNIRIAVNFDSDVPQYADTSSKNEFATLLATELNKVTGVKNSIVEISGSKPYLLTIKTTVTPTSEGEFKLDLENNPGIINNSGKIGLTGISIKLMTLKDPVKYTFGLQSNGTVDLNTDGRNYRTNEDIFSDGLNPQYYKPSDRVPNLYQLAFTKKTENTEILANLIPFKRTWEGLVDEEESVNKDYANKIDKNNLWFAQMEDAKINSIAMKRFDQHGGVDSYNNYNPTGGNFKFYKSVSGRYDGKYEVQYLYPINKAGGSEVDVTTLTSTTQNYTNPKSKYVLDTLPPRVTSITKKAVLVSADDFNNRKALFDSSDDKTGKSLVSEDINRIITNSTKFNNAHVGALFERTVVMSGKFLDKFSLVLEDKYIGTWGQTEALTYHLNNKNYGGLSENNPTLTWDLYDKDVEFLIVKDHNRNWGLAKIVGNEPLSIKYDGSIPSFNRNQKILNKDNEKFDFFSDKPVKVPMFTNNTYAYSISNDSNNINITNDKTKLPSISPNQSSTAYAFSSSGVYSTLPFIFDNSVDSFNAKVDGTYNNGFWEVKVDFGNLFETSGLKKVKVIDKGKATEYELVDKKAQFDFSTYSSLLKSPTKSKLISTSSSTIMTIKLKYSSPPPSDVITLEALDNLDNSNDSIKITINFPKYVKIIGAKDGEKKIIESKVTVNNKLNIKSSKQGTKP